ncbi:uncharacterized protein LOC122860715 [Aphidius gifuensis]|uniref:uncharacterized protein LOC122860715 n=1 Tax=Aphidius gifuensis TaxID=684658 RepID=UPI001CDB91FA|nr:uncharacterized protein LOC122860715 [Aphidius gifuensis]
MQHLIKIFVLFCVIATALARSGSITVKNGGGYVALFSVEYTKDGKRQSAESGDFTAGVSKTIQIPDGARDVFVKAEVYWFIASRAVIFTKHYDGPEQKCFKVWGTTLNTAWDERNCGDL